MTLHYEGPKATDQFISFLLKITNRYFLLLDSHSNILRNSYESDGGIQPFLSVLLQYRKHVAVYLALRVVKDQKVPAGIPGNPYRYPNELSRSVWKSP